jgi:hypothetical protein
MQVCIDQNPMENKQHDLNAFAIISLDRKEAEEPLSVLASFFNDHTLEERLAQLREWRRCVLVEGESMSDNEGPAGLLKLHKATVKLLEALYLLSVTDDKIAVLSDPEQLQLEKAKWSSVPVMLDDDVLASPVILIEDFYHAYTLKEVRNCFWNGWC